MDVTFNCGYLLPQTVDNSKLETQESEREILGGELLPRLQCAKRRRDEAFKDDGDDNDLNFIEIERSMKKIKFPGSEISVKIKSLTGKLVELTYVPL